MTYLSMGADTVVHVTASRKFERKENIRLRVDHLIQANDVRVLKLFHRFDFTLHFLLHAQLADLVFVEDFEGNGFTNCFILSHYVNN